MNLEENLHLAYCTNIHRGENWAETFSGLKDHTLKVKDRVAPDQSFAIGLRLSDQAARELISEGNMQTFKSWMEEFDCYVFTINGFPFGQFHGGQVKEQVYLPDWTSRKRLDYTKLLFDILVELMPEGAEGSISTCPGSFKEFSIDMEAEYQMHQHLRECMEHIEILQDRKGQRLHLGLEPEPLCHFETSEETVDFFERMFVSQHQYEDRLRACIGVNYDTCHLAVEFENAREAIGNIRDAGILLSKIHLSSALRVVPTPELLEQLQAFQEDTYLHQVVVKTDTELRRFRDLNLALAYARDFPQEVGNEWRIHFHIPLHHIPDSGLLNTSGHLLETLDLLAADPDLCHHLEMETYTWEVLPDAMRQTSVVDQLVKEYRWCLKELKRRKLA